MKQKNKLFTLMYNEKGQTLIEVLVGLGAAVAVMAAMTIATISALNNAQYSRSQNLATNYAQQGMEVVKNLQKIDYATFSSLDGTYCFADTCNEIDANLSDQGQSCAKISGTRCPGTLNVHSQFIRTVTFHTNDAEVAKCNADGGTNNTKVDVTLAWYDQRCTSSSNLYCHQVVVSSCFNDAEIVPAP